MRNLIFESFLKSWNLFQILRFLADFLHVTPYITMLQMLYSNMGSKMTPSLISEGGGPLRPSDGGHRIRYPMGGRVKTTFIKQTLWVQYVNANFFPKLSLKGAIWKFKFFRFFEKRLKNAFLGGFQPKNKKINVDISYIQSETNSKKNLRKKRNFP